MAQIINTNLSSLNAQRNLNKSQGSLSTSLQRLSSGLRINRAKDDAAGLAISNKMTSQIRGLNQAVRNANDGISVAQTAEGALEESTNSMQRIRELAIQSANGSNSASERKALQQEVGQLISEVNRIADTTAFGGRKLLDGSFGSSSFQVGSAAFETINVSIGSFRANQMGNNTQELQSVTTGAGFGQATAGNATTALANSVSGTLTINSTTTPSAGTVVTLTGLSAKGSEDLINAQTSVTGVSADARTTASFATSAAGTVSFNLTGSNTNAVTISANVTTTDYTSLAAAINNQSGQTGISAAIDNGTLKLTSERGDDIKIEAFNHSTALSTATVTGYSYDGGTASTGTAATLTQGSTNSTRVMGDVKLNSAQSFSTTASTTSVDSVATAQASTLEEVAQIDVSTAIGAQKALSVIDAAVSFVDSNRASLGAVQNRLESTIANLANVSENVSAARSRIVDADFAQETANLTKNQILQQAGISVLSQANSLPQQVLSLLQ
ncbi:MAG: flagellin [Spongiibacteraceae bacterium]